MQEYINDENKLTHVIKLSQPVAIKNDLSKLLIGLVLYHVRVIHENLMKANL